LQLIDQVKLGLARGGLTIENLASAVMASVLMAAKFASAGLNVGTNSVNGIDPLSRLQTGNTLTSLPSTLISLPENCLA